MTRLVDNKSVVRLINRSDLHPYEFVPVIVLVVQLDSLRWTVKALLVFR